MPRRPDVPCAGCGKLIWRGRGVLPPGQSTCQSCRADGRGPKMRGGRNRGSTPPRFRPRTCRHCGQEFAPPLHGNYRRTTCSDACAAARAAAGGVSAGGSCIACGVAISYRGLCLTCRALRKRARDRRRKAFKRGCRGDDPPMTIDQLGARDGWRCHLCRRKVHRHLRVPHPGAPTFDHLVPVSASGSDDHVNLRLAHYRCNSRRGTGGTVQLLLVG